MADFDAIVSKLAESITDTSPMLQYRSPFQLLISVILSAQTTDEQVNGVTPGLFERFPDADSLAGASTAELEELVHSTGFFRSKARHIKGAATALRDRFGGVVPDTIEELVSLPGVGRKSANVALGTVFGRPAIIVDTHLRRVARRLGLTVHQDPTKIELDLASRVVPDVQYRLSMLLNRHGRLVCTSRRPKCGECVLRDVCSWPDRGSA